MKHDNCRTCIPAMFCIHPAYSNSCSKPKPSLHVHVKVLLLDFTFSLKHPTAAPHLACGWRAAAVRPIIKICIFHIYFRFLIKSISSLVHSCCRVIAQSLQLCRQFSLIHRGFFLHSPLLAQLAQSLWRSLQSVEIESFLKTQKEMCRPSANRYEVVRHLPQLALHHKFIYEGLELHCPWAAQLMQHLFSL